MTSSSSAIVLQAKTATLADRPDLFARRDDEAAIIDAETCEGSASHVVQVIIYP